MTLNCTFSTCSKKLKSYNQLCKHTRSYHYIVGKKCDRCPIYLETEDDLWLHIGRLLLKYFLRFWTWNISIFKVENNLKKVISLLDIRHHHNAEYYCQLCHKGCSSKALLNSTWPPTTTKAPRKKNGCGFAPAASKIHLGKFFKGSSDQSHFIFEINVGKRRKMTFVAVELLNYFVISVRHYKAVRIVAGVVVRSEFQNIKWPPM